MIKEWETYYVVVVAALLGLGIPLGLTGLSRLFEQLGTRPSRQGQHTQKKSKSSESRMGTFHSRYYLAGLLAYLLFVSLLLFFPLATALKSATSGAEWTRALVLILILGAALSLLISYNLRKGDLNWIRTFLRRSK